MQTLKNTFLYSLLALSVVGLIFVLVPNDASAQIYDLNCGCDIQITQAPSSGSVGDSVGPFRIEVECYQTQHITYSLENRSDGEYIMGPTTYNDEGRYTYSSNHTFSSSGSKQLRANVQAIGYSNSCDYSDSDTDYISISGGGSVSMDVSISGASSVNLSDDPTKTYTADFDYTGDEARYRFHVNGNEWRQNYRNTSGSSANVGIDWRDFGTGTHRICVDAFAVDGSTISPLDTSCMNVEVDEQTETIGGCTDPDANNYDPNADFNDGSCDYDNDDPDPEPGEATLRVDSSNPSSGAGMSITSDGNNNMPSNFSTSRTFDKNDDIIVTIWANSSASGNSFSDWDGCDSRSGRRCDVRVNTGNSKTVRANYSGGSDPDPEPDEATLRVRSTNPFSGVNMDVTSGGLSDFSTERTFSDDDDIDVTIWAQNTTSDGSTFSDWDGCDSSSGRRCDVRVNTGQSQTITANYSGGGSDPDPEPDPDQAVLEVSSTPFTGVPIHHVHGWLLGSGDDTNYSRGYDNDIQQTWIQAPTTYSYGGTDYQIESWDGCNGTGDGGRSCRVAAFDVGETRSITVNYEAAPEPVEGCTDPDAENYDSDAEVDDGSCVYQAEINSFSASDPQLDFEASPPELHVDDQPFTLIWNTEHANTVTGASSESTEWPGNKSLNGSENINEGSIPGTFRDFTYSLTAHAPGGNASESITVRLLDPPSFEIDAESETNIDGEPGAQATNQVTLTSRKYDGDVEFTVDPDDIPEILKDEEGNSKIRFTFDPDELDTEGATTLTIEILQPIYENISETIRITGTDQSGTAEPEVEYTEFILNIDGFNPRTIEEF